MQEGPSSLLEDVKYWEPVHYMTRMKMRWNLLDFDDKNAIKMNEEGI